MKMENSAAAVAPVSSEYWIQMQNCGTEQLDPKICRPTRTCSNNSPPSVVNCNVNGGSDFRRNGVGRHSDPRFSGYSRWDYGSYPYFKVVAAPSPYPGAIHPSAYHPRHLMDPSLRNPSPQHPLPPDVYYNPISGVYEYLTAGDCTCPLPSSLDHRHRLRLPECSPADRPPESSPELCLPGCRPSPGNQNSESTDSSDPAGTGSYPCRSTNETHAHPAAALQKQECMCTGNSNNNSPDVVPRVHNTTTSSIEKSIDAPALCLQNAGSIPDAYNNHNHHHHHHQLHQLLQPKRCSNEIKTERRSLPDSSISSRSKDNSCINNSSSNHINNGALSSSSSSREQVSGSDKLQVGDDHDDEIKIESMKVCLLIEETMTKPELLQQQQQPDTTNRSTPPQKTNSPGKSPDLNMAHRNRKVTPLYGLPSWWGDEPYSSEVVSQQQINCRASVSSTSSLPSSFVPSSSYSPTKPNNEITEKTTSSSSPETNLNPRNQTESSRIGTFENPRHSPPERDTDSLIHMRDPKCRTDFSNPAFSSGTTGLQPRPPHPPPPIPSSPSMTFRAATSFTVDLAAHDDDDDDDGEKQPRLISIKNSLSEFLPRRCERNLQRRLSWIRQRSRKRVATTIVPAGRNPVFSENECLTHHQLQPNRSQVVMVSTMPSSFRKDSFEEVIADDVSEAGTYTIDVNSDSEFRTPDEAAVEGILAAFGIASDDETIAEQKTPTGEACHTIFSEGPCPSDSRPKNGEVSSSDEGFISTQPIVHSPPTPSKKSNVGLVLTIYTESPTSKQPAMSSWSSGSRTEEVVEDGDDAGTSRQMKENPQDTSRSIRSLDTAVLLADSDWYSKGRETWRSQASMDTAVLLREPGRTDLDDDYESESTIDGGGFGSSSQTTEHARGSNRQVENRVYTRTNNSSDLENYISTTDGNYFKTLVSNHTRMTASFRDDDVTGRYKPNSLMSDSEPTSQRSVNESEIGESLAGGSAGSGSITLGDMSPRTDFSLDTRVLLQDPDEDHQSDRKIRSDVNETGFHLNGRLPSSYSPEYDEDGSPVDPMVEPDTVRTFASLTTEVLLKPTEEVIQVLGKKKNRSHKVPKSQTLKQMEENQIPYKSIKELVAKSNLDENNRTDFGLSSTRAVVSVCDTRESGIRVDAREDVVENERVTSTKPLKTKPPTPKSGGGIKASSLTSGGRDFASRRCFSDVDVAGTDSERTNVSMSGENRSSVKGTGFTVDHTKMNRTFALRRARLEAGDRGTETPRSDISSTIAERSTRTSAKKAGSYNPGETQRSRSASRSRLGMVSSRASFDSSRSIETVVSLGQKIVRKSREGEKKSKQGTETSHPKPFSHDDGSSSVCSYKPSLPFHPPMAVRAGRKKTTSSSSGKASSFRDDELDAAAGLSIKGSNVLSRPLSSSTTAPDTAADNEWTRRKQYNPRQSLQNESSLNKSAHKRDDAAVTRRNLRVSGLDTESKTKQKSSSSIGSKDTSSDGTDDERHTLSKDRSLSAIRNLSDKVKLLSDQILHVMRKRPDFRSNENIFRNQPQAQKVLESSASDSLQILRNLQTAEQQMSAILKVLTTDTNRSHRVSQSDVVVGQ